MELAGTQKALAAREAELRDASSAAQQLPGVQSEAQRLQAEVWHSSRMLIPESSRTRCIGWRRTCGRLPPPRCSCPASNQKHSACRPRCDSIAKNPVPDCHTAAFVGESHWRRPPPSRCTLYAQRATGALAVSVRLLQPCPRF